MMKEIKHELGKMIEGLREIRWWRNGANGQAEGLEKSHMLETRVKENIETHGCSICTVVNNPILLLGAGIGMVVNLT